MKKQTAVEWLVEKLNLKYGNDDFIITHINEIGKAKAMERQQIVDAYDEALLKSWQDNGEQYYNETFNK